ncbi:MAG: 50S ribosomal protein L25 [Nitrospiraceae bacterium]|nr:50S ribosomal protein L25 [Nitrospiraceae bacterium]
MERITIQAEKRAEVGKGAARTLRGKDVVPAVLYRAGGSLPIKIKRAELLRFLHQTSGEQVVVNLTFPEGETRLALVKDFQVDPVNRELLHTDFFEVSLQETIKVTMAVHIVGEPIGVKRDGAILQHGISEIDVECLPDRIMGHVDVDVSELGAGHSLHVRDIKLPEGIKVLTPASEVVALVALPSKVEEAAPAAAAEAAEPEVIKKGGKEKEEAEEGKEGKK